MQVPVGYERAVRFAGLCAITISPYLILYFIVLILIGGLADNSGIGQTLEFAWNSPMAFNTTIFLDGLFHVLFLVPVVGLHALLRPYWPMRANLVLGAGIWQMLMGFSKALIKILSFDQLGAAHVHADAALRTALLPMAASQDGLRNALQWMDSLGVLAVWMLIALLPGESRLPHLVRWLGWLMSLATLSPDSAFLLVIVLSPIWLFMLGR